MSITRVPKCVKAYGDLKDNEKEVIELFDRFLRCTNFLFDRFCGVKHMTDVCDWRTIRNLVRKEQEEIVQKRKDTGKTDQLLLTEMFNFQGRHYTQAIKQVCMNLNSMWSGLARKLKGMVRENDNLTDTMRSYCYYVLSVRELWYQVIMQQPLPMKTKKGAKTIKELAEKLTDEEFNHCNQYLRRLTRKHKPHPHASKCAIPCDEMMYSIKKTSAGTFLSFMSAKKKKPFTIKLHGPWCYRKTGDVLLVLDRDKHRVAIHKCIKARTKETNWTNELGVDKGLSTLLSCSSGNEYGIGYGKSFVEEVERINKRNTNRNSYIQKKKELNEAVEYKNLQISLAQGYKKIQFIREKANIVKQLNNLEANNLGNKKYNREHARVEAGLENIINHEIRRMILEEQSGVLGKEDLSFTKDKKDKSKPKMYAQAERKLNTWQKGILNERLEYICFIYQVKTVDVNPAYTSQFCAECGAKLDGRTGLHHEIGKCPNCGPINANTNAGKNIKERMHDEEISLYTSYKKVKEILTIRYTKRTEAEASTQTQKAS